MGTSLPFSHFTWAIALLCLFYVTPTHAFGAGNIASISSVEGSNFRHGDIEDTLLTLLTSYAYAKGAKFSKLDVKRVYFGNWLRDYSQAVDVGTVKHVSAEAIRILLWTLGFLTFGFGTGEFEVTSQRLGCYRPEEHIDNPKDYADNEDARNYDRRLRGPVDEEVELAIDPRSGLKAYIASEDKGITTSAGMVRKLFGRCIELGRSYNRSRNKAELWEAFRLLGTACHCLEDYSAHSNYTELALIEMGERDVFPHVGRRTQVQVQGARHAVWPIVTGTFGGVDFLHSVMGELDDKTTQSEVQELEGVLQQSQGQDTSMLKKLLDALPSSLLGGKNSAGKVDELQSNATAAQMENLNVSPRRPEEWTQQLNAVAKQIYPIMEFHDDIMKSITETIDKIPVLPDLIEQIQEQISVFVFSLLAPFVLPIIRQVQTELATGSSEVIQSSREQQLIVFHDDRSSNPTHSMLSKDHFSNILNEPAGKVSCEVLKWVVPQIVSCWDNDNVDVERTLNRIISGVFHHPALREHGNDGARDGRSIMFNTVHQWWSNKSEREKDDLRQKLSRQGVETGQNHKEGVEDKGHGCGKPMKLPQASNSGGAAAVLGGLGAMGGLGGAMSGNQHQQQQYSGGNGGGFEQKASSFASEAVGGGALGGLVGGLVGGLLGDKFGKKNSDTQQYQQSGYNPDGSYTNTVMETGHVPQQSGYGGGSYEQAEYKTTQYASGGYKQEYERFDQQGSSGYGYEAQTEVRPTGSGGYDQRTEHRYERPDGRWESEVQQLEMDSSGRYHQTEQVHHGRRHEGKDSSDSDNDSGDDWETKERKRRAKAAKKERKRREEEEKQQQRRHHGGGGRRNSGSDSDGEKRQHGRRHSGERQHRQQEFYQQPSQPAYGESFEQRRQDFEQPVYGERPYGGGNVFEQGPPPPQPGFGNDEWGNRPGGYGGGGYGEPPNRQQEFGGGYGGPPGGYGEEMPGGFPGEGGEGYGYGGGQEQRHHGRGGHHGQHHGGGGGGW